MVKYYLSICLYFLWIWIPQHACADNVVFTLTPQSQEGRVGEAIILHARLEGALFTGEADVSALRSLGSIRQTGSNKVSTNFNGVRTTIEQRSYRFIPKNVGQMTVPPLTFPTSQGPRLSAPFTLNIAENPSLGDDIRIALHAPKGTLYKGASFILTLTIDTKNGIGDTSSEAFSSQDMMFEEIGHHMYDKREDNGTTRKIIENYYVATPLRSGRITIPSFTLSGFLRGEIRSGIRSMLPFGLMMTPRGKEFHVSSDPLSISITPLPAFAADLPPATDLRITEQSAHIPSLMVNTPYIRTFLIEGQQITSSRLPTLSSDMVAGTDMRVYTSPAQTTDDFSDRTLYAKKRLRYTIVPDKVGSTRLPAIRIPWFNIDTGRKEFLTVPERMIHIVQDPTTDSADITSTASPHIGANTEGEREQALHTSFQSKYVKYIALTVCLLVIVAMVYYVYRIFIIDYFKQRKRRQTLIYAIANSDDAHDILAYLSQWPTVKTASETAVHQRLASLLSEHARSDFLESWNKLESAAYSPHGSDQEDVCSARDTLLSLLRTQRKKHRNMSSRGTSDPSQGLNPL